MSKKIDYKKEFPKLYRPSQNPHIIEIPNMKFFMVDGEGYPENNPSYQEAMSLLYGVIYTLKMQILKPRSKDFVVPPLEGLWWAENMDIFTVEDTSKYKDDWLWTMMIRIPDFAVEDHIQEALERFKRKKDPENFDRLYTKEYHEGTVVQVLYIGPYSNEGPTIQEMHKYANENGYLLQGKHHEIYLNDTRRTKPEDLKTIIRQPIVKKD